MTMSMMASVHDPLGSSGRHDKHPLCTTGIYDERRYTGNGAAVSPGKAASTPTPTRARSREAASRKADSGMVDCPCGVTIDDGEAMIECERCKVRGGSAAEVWSHQRLYVCLVWSPDTNPVLFQVWAHLSCLQAQMSQHPRHFHYKFAHYMCDLCQHELRLQAAQVGARAAPAQAGSQQKTGPACARNTEVSSHHYCNAHRLSILCAALSSVLTPVTWGICRRSPRARP